MRFIFRHKYLCIFIIMLLIIGGGTFYVLKTYGSSLFIKDTKTANYGSRLDGIEQVMISDTKVEEVKREIASNEQVKKVSYNLEGRIVNFIIDVNKDMPIGDAKKLSEIVMSLLDDDQKVYYDTQIYLITSDSIGEEEAKNYPIIGYRHKSTDKFTWTK